MLQVGTKQIKRNTTKQKENRPIFYFRETRRDRDSCHPILRHGRKLEIVVMMRGMVGKALQRCGSFYLGGAKPRVLENESEPLYVRTAVCTIYRASNSPLRAGLESLWRSFVVYEYLQNKRFAGCQVFKKY